VGQFEGRLLGLRATYLDTVAFTTIFPAWYIASSFVAGDMANN